MSRCVLAELSTAAADTWTAEVQQLKAELHESNALGIHRSGTHSYVWRSHEHPCHRFAADHNIASLRDSSLAYIHDNFSAVTQVEFVLSGISGG